jgi:hypothetical protein
VTVSNHQRSHSPLQPPIPKPTAIRDHCGFDCKGQLQCLFVRYSLFGKQRGQPPQSSKMMNKFRRMPLNWKILLGVQAVLTLGILGNRIYFLQGAQRGAQQERLEVEAYRGIKARDAAQESALKA